MNLSATSWEVLVLFGAVLAYGLWRVHRFLRFIYGTSLRILPGPVTPSWVYGNQKDLETLEGFLQPDRWFEQYGSSFMDREFFMVPRLWTLDPRALNHILTHSNNYQKPATRRRAVLDILGAGILFAEGERHRLQRRILNPAFGPAQIRDVTGIFVQKSVELRDLWAAAARSHAEDQVVLDVNEGLSNMTLDVIGLAGFGYEFNALDPEAKPRELMLAFRKLFMNAPPLSAIGLPLLNMFPLLKLVLPNKRMEIIKHASQVMRRVGAELVERKKAEIVREMGEKRINDLERKDLQGRDLLTVLMRANMAKDVPEHRKMSDLDVLAQIPAFLTAGHETTATSATWALYALSRDLAVQQKLREELLAVQTGTPTMDELTTLPYLDAVVRETLRLYPPITVLVREAMKDDVIPLSEPFTDRYGNVHNEIRIAQGNKVAIPILAMQRSTKIWGEDAMEFRPERWLHPPQAASTIPGVWGHLLVFIGGPRACIGYRFALLELKTILFTLVRSFEFSLAVTPEEIMVKPMGFQRPSLRSKPEQGCQLPLVVKPYKVA